MKRIFVHLSLATLVLAGMSDHFSMPLRDVLPDGTFSEVQRQAFSTDVFADEAINAGRSHENITARLGGLLQAKR